MGLTGDLCGCGHSEARHCQHCGLCNGTLGELGPEYDNDMPAGTVCLCTEFGIPEAEARALSGDR